jgi:hypothetical protein
MRTAIQILSGELAVALRAYIDRKLRFSLSRFAGRLGRVRVRVANVDGHAGGKDVSCRIRAELLPSRSQVIHETVNARHEVMAAVALARTSLRPEELEDAS